MFTCWHLGAILLLAHGATSIGAYELCRGLKIYILDLNTFAEQAGYPTCTSEEKFVVDAKLGIVYLRIGEHHPGLPNKPDYYSVHHKFGTHAAPWYVAQAIQNSDCFVDSIDAAQLVYVFDYCFYIWWVAQEHSMKGDYSIPKDHPARLQNPGEYLLKGWKAVTQMPRFQQTKGRDFIFYDPHPGFAEGAEGEEYHRIICDELKDVLHVLVDIGQRTFCYQYWKWQNVVITPNNPSVIDINKPNTSTTFLRPRMEGWKRQKLLYFSGACRFPPTLGKKYREMVFLGLRDCWRHTEGVSVQCTDAGGVHTDFDQNLKLLEHHKFCLALPGDSASTRRLSEIFMSGCIPVFLGPPYNSMPFPIAIDYRSAGVFFNVTNTSSWLPKPMQWSFSDESHGTYPGETNWWLPDIPIHDVAIQVQNVEDIIPHLAKMPEEELNRKFDLMDAYRFYMVFQEVPGQRVTAEQLVIRAIRRKTSAAKKLARQQARKLAARRASGFSSQHSRKWPLRIDHIEHVVQPFRPAVE